MVVCLPATQSCTGPCWIWDRCWPNYHTQRMSSDMYLLAQNPSADRQREKTRQRERGEAREREKKEADQWKWWECTEGILMTERRNTCILLCDIRLPRHALTKTRDTKLRSHDKEQGRREWGGSDSELTAAWRYTPKRTKAKWWPNGETKVYRSAVMPAHRSEHPLQVIIHVLASTRRVVIELATLGSTLTACRERERIAWTSVVRDIQSGSCKPRLTNCVWSHAWQLHARSRKKKLKLNAAFLTALWSHEHCDKTDTQPSTHINIEQCERSDQYAP